MAISLRLSRISMFPPSRRRQIAVQRNAVGVRGVSNTGLMNQAPTRPCFACATYRGVQRGFAPLRFLSSLKIRGQQLSYLSRYFALTALLRAECNRFLSAVSISVN
jgi:hypothetical protein